MIEFKGECGHTIRAKDDDAGKVVRCSYCGREAQVPEEEDEIDFLLTEVERTGDFDPPKSRRKARPRAAAGTTAPIRPKSDFNPFGVALKMCYAALIITVMIVVGKGVYKRLVPDSGGTTASSRTPKEPTATPVPAPTPVDTSAVGLLNPRLNRNESGIYITSVPLGAEVYIREARTTGVEVDILRDPHIRHRCRSGEPAAMGQGSYEVAITLQLTDPALMNLPGYGELREAIESRPKEADDRLDKYFIKHGQGRVSMGELSDKSRVIVMYYDVEVDRNSWTPCTGLFLPGHTPLSGLMAYLPKARTFGFEADVVRGELTFHKVPVEDQTFILDALAQIGMVPYRRDAKSDYQLFWIRLIDGKVSTRVLSPNEKRKGT